MVFVLISILAILACHILKEISLKDTTELDRLGSSLRSQSENDGITRTAL